MTSLPECDVSQLIRLPAFHESKVSRDALLHDVVSTIKIAVLRTENVDNDNAGVDDFGLGLLLQTKQVREHIIS